jgi:hypothetical protein
MRNAGTRCALVIAVTSGARTQGDDSIGVSAMFRLKTWIWTLGLLFVETFTACVLWNVVNPNPTYIRMLETFFPGFKWLSIKSLALGGLESFLYAAYLAGSFVLIHNFLHRKHHKEVQVPHGSKRAA